MNVVNKRLVFEQRSDSENLDAIPSKSLPDGTMEFLLVLAPGFSQLCLSSFISPLLYANRLSGREQFRWKLISDDGTPVVCASGVRVCVDASLGEEAKLLKSNRLPAGIAICTGEGIEHYQSGPLVALLRLCARRNVRLYGLGTGAWILAAAGLLSDTRCTIHWDMMAAFSETFDGLKLTDALFVEQGGIVTCAGEFAAFDLAISLVERRCGADVARSVCRFLTADRWREGESYQSTPPGLRFNGASERLIRIIRMMENSIDEPLSLGAISRLEGLSRRQIERLFLRHLQTPPMRYYLLLRMARARQLIELTDMSVLEVAITCGFTSSSHFSKCFRDHFTQAPSSLRRG
ncbi:GlxA family transcriptional regulator (plasmid) [Aminobacter sp. SR38]|jgi:transcriptional regulator GlxA family with amidase domain|uniref:GlxA family transcriptional regulator n=1 Tax=Aminobacter sp. SR38 TaxID=2774562 RepID=UPI001782A714|nr:GlxA family transcriptional regulator [Aminobacter sp. SR38]QOF75081.1 GlxA family transcriptional regulator [Aminobacter sp. SR38]